MPEKIYQENEFHHLSDGERVVVEEGLNKFIATLKKQPWEVRRMYMEALVGTFCECGRDLGCQCRNDE